MLLDGLAVRSCLVFAVQADGAEVTTVEGLAPEQGLSPLQQAFERHSAFQCGFCTPGFLVAAEAIRRSRVGQKPDRAELRRLLSGNLCRCTGYETILRAVEECL